MRVTLASLESFYDNSLALDYLSGYAQARPLVRDHVEIRTVVQRMGDTSGSGWGRIFESPFDLVGFNTYVWNIESSLEAAKEVKRRNPSAIVVMGGMEATYTAPKLLSDVPEIDFVVVGEGEVIFADLLERLYCGEQLSGRIPGLGYRDTCGNVVFGGTGPIVQNLDEIPSPFLNPAFAHRQLRDVLYESYRGCAFHCSFCLYHRDYTKQRYFSLERVAADIQALREVGCPHIRFVDSTFNLSKSRVKDILRLLRGIDADVSVEVSAEFFDDEMVEMFPQAGIRHVDIGLQSTNRSALATINREWYREERFKANLSSLKNNPALTLNVELIAGLPSDSYEGLKRSIDEAVSLWPDHVSIYRLLGLKGTDVERQKEMYGLRFSDRPPYELVESREFSVEVLAEIELFTFAHLLLFNLGIGRYALRYAIDLASKKPTSLYELFWRFVLERGLYTQEEARLLSRFYAYGNRFDRDLPDGLDPLRIKTVLECFFRECSDIKLDILQKEILSELIDYGFQLALLDGQEEKARSVQYGQEDSLLIAPWCRRRYYSANLFSEMIRQQAEFDEMSPDEISSIIFFVHPELGPASLAIDQAMDHLLSNYFAASHALILDQEWLPCKRNKSTTALPDGAQSAFEQLVDLRILIPSIYT